MIDIIKDYDSQPAFADFLPGIAGENGIPASVSYTHLRAHET